tara:strand:- start:140 stop:2095 length:1956 start_codon:yes stop_codon:yes gene_type:complete
MAKLTDEELLARVDSEVNSAQGNNDELSDIRRDALLRYYGKPYGNEIEGRSQVVDTTVMDTIEWIKPSLMRIFAGSDEIVKFNPEGPEDVPGAKQATDYVNYILTKDNNWFNICLSWFQDALCEKLGIVKCWWDDADRWDREEYHDLTDFELESLISSDDVEVLEHTEKGNEEEIEDETSITEVLHDVVITRHARKGRVKIDSIPPEEFLISIEAKDVESARFVCHRRRMTISELREMGYDVDEEEIGSDDTMDFNDEREARFSFDSNSDVSLDDNGVGPTREVWVNEAFLKIDYDDDGIAELRRIFYAGRQIFENEPVDRVPFATVTPIPLPHQIFGMSITDQVEDLQLIKTTLLRNLLDNMYLQNAGRVAVQEGMVNLDDLLTQRPGGIVRTKAQGAVQPLPTPPLQPYVFQMMQYLDQIREERSGISRMSQGLDDQALTSHTTATAVTQVMTAAQQRVELIARVFAETGVKKLAEMVYELVSKHQDKERMIMLRNEWVPVRPDMWKDRMDCTVAVGLGNGNRDQKAMQLAQLTQFASQAMAGGLSIVNEQNLYNLGAQMIENMGFKDVDSFLTDPSKVPPQGPSPEQQLAQAEIAMKQKELEIKAADVQIKAARIENDRVETQIDANLKAQELALEAQQNRPVAIGAT